jgi:multidrug efflux pump subunit AcrA (membrane-fusion protein)
MSAGRPRLRADLVVVEQCYRGERSFVVKDPLSLKYFRFRPLEVQVMRALDGRRSAGEAAEALRAEGVPVSAGVLEGFARQLGRLGLLERSVAERSTLAMERLRAERNRRRRSPLFRGELMRMRWSFGDPNALFDRWMPRLGFLWSRPFAALSLLLFAAYFAVLATRWDDFTAALAGLSLTSGDAAPLAIIATFWVTALVIVGFHELAHGLTCKRFGGEVHEMGAMLIYLQPAFYCNVNDAWTFPERRARLWVTVAGPWVQLMCAAVAALAWAAVQPGTLAARVAVAAILFGGGTALIANLNPLIPLDGYYALSDWLEIPNLRQRAFDYVRAVAKRRVLRLDVPVPDVAPHEARVFLIYGCLATLYIVTVLSVVVALLFGWAAEALGVAGALVVLAGAWLAFRQPLREAAATLRLAWREHAGAWRRRSSRLGWRLAGLALLVVGAAALVPRPVTIVGGFTLAPALAVPAVAGGEGSVARVHVREGTRVRAGDPLVQLRDLALERRIAAASLLADSLAAETARARSRGAQGEVGRLEAEHAAEAARLAALQGRLGELTVRARTAGVIVTPRPEHLIGRRVARGATLLVIGRPDSVEARIALDGAGATLVRAGQRAGLVSLADPAHPVAATVASVAPAASGPGGDARLEARVRLPAGAAWRPGMRGEASVRLRGSSVLGATVWGIRKRIRTDLLL